MVTSLVGSELAKLGRAVSAGLCEHFDLSRRQLFDAVRVTGLRTFSAQESRTVLGVPDAYELPAVPGLGYLKPDQSTLLRFKAAYVSGAPSGRRTHVSRDAGGHVRGILPFTISEVQALEPAETHEDQVVAPVPPGQGEQPSLLDTAVDRMVGQALDMAGAGGTVVLATALSQQPCLRYEETGGKTFYRPKVFDRLLAHTEAPAIRFTRPVNFRSLPPPVTAAIASRTTSAAGRSRRNRRPRSRSVDRLPRAPAGPPTARPARRAARPCRWS